MRHLVNFNEMIKIPIKVGDTVLCGKFKNRKIIVKKIGKNEKGDITINGKPLLRFRIFKEGLLTEKFYNLKGDIKSKLDSIITDLLSKYRKQEFFHKLDDSIKDITNQDIILSLVKGLSNEYIVSSGGFGDKLYDLYIEGKFKCKGVLVFNGKMTTKDKGITYWYPARFDIENKEFVFVDDSYFSGKNSDRVGEFLNANNSSIKSVSVIYDGCKEKRKGVNSFFRYYS